MRAKQELVISGAGVVSPFGVGLNRLLDALREGLSAVGPILSFDSQNFPTRVAGQVPIRETSASWVLEQAHAQVTLEHRQLLEDWQKCGLFRDRKAAFAWLAAHEAWSVARCDDSSRVSSVCLGLGLEQAFLEDLAPFVSAGAVDWDRVRAHRSSRMMFRSEVDLSARLIAETWRLEGAVLSNSSACAAGTMAVAQAAASIARGQAHSVVCGASDSMLNPLGVGGMSRLGAPSPRESSEACRPFDRARDGLAMGEGAAVFVLETRERALLRGARPLARVLGWGVTQDGYRATAPRPDGVAAALAMRRAIESAGISPEQVGYVNAHGTGTPLNDPAESRAIQSVFKKHRPYVSSIKGAVGHLMAASGAIELASCLLAFERGLLPGTANFSQLDPECEGLNVIGPKPLAAQVDYVLSNSFGFGGQNACVVLGREGA